MQHQTLHRQLNRHNICGSLRPWRASVCRRRVQAGARASSVSSVDTAGMITQFGFRRTFADEYEVGDLLGSGSFGTVHVAIERSTGYKYAVKSIPKRFLGSYLEPHFVARIQHEVDVYRHMGQSLNVAHLQEAFEDDVSVDLVMELCTGGELWKRIKRGHYSEKRAASIIRQVLAAVAQCHAKGIIVRDVKPDNFLFLNDREDAPLKMVDFGLADHCQPGQKLRERCGTPAYVAPEVLKQSYSIEADIWSAGMLAYQLLAGRFPWANDPDIRSEAFGEEGGSFSDKNGQLKMTNQLLFRAIMYAKFDYEWPPWDQLSDRAKDFVQAMLRRDPAERPTAAELLHHPWLEWAAGATTSSTDSDDLPLDDTLVQRLQRYGTYGRLKQLALCRIAGIIQDDDVRLTELRQAFQQLDQSGTGKVPYDQLKAVLQQYDLSRVEVRTLMSQFDLDADGHIDLNEWLAALIDWQQLQDSPRWEEWLHRVFDAFDTTHSGTLTWAELRNILCSDDEDTECTPDMIAAALREADTNHDGVVSFSEFEALMQTDKTDRLDLFAARRLKDGHRTADRGSTEQH